MLLFLYFLFRQSLGQSLGGYIWNLFVANNAKQLLGRHFATAKLTILFQITSVGVVKLFEMNMKKSVLASFTATLSDYYAMETWIGNV